MESKNSCIGDTERSKSKWKTKDGRRVSVARFQDDDLANPVEKSAQQLIESRKRLFRVCDRYDQKIRCFFASRNASEQKRRIHETEFRQVKHLNVP